MDDTTNVASSNNCVLSLIHSLVPSGMYGDLPKPFRNMKYESAVNAMPPKMPIPYLE